jgi:hypothetical protein
VAATIGSGASNAEVAAALFLSEATVKAHVSRLFTKLDVTNRVQIAIVVHDADQSQTSYQETIPGDQRRRGGSAHAICTFTRPARCRSGMTLVGASHGDDDLSLGVSFAEIPDGFGDPTQRVAPINDRGYLAGLDEGRVLPFL